MGIPIPTADLLIVYEANANGPLIRVIVLTHAGKTRQSLHVHLKANISQLNVPHGTKN